MTLLTHATPGTDVQDAVTPAEPERPARFRRVPALPSGWPLVLLFAGYPVWWALGCAPFVALLSTVPLIAELRRRGRLHAPSGFGLWVMLLLWMLVGVLLLQVDAPGAVPGNSNGRYLVFAYRFGWFVGAAVVLLYVVNMRDRLSSMWFCRTVGSMFIVCVAGGLLGALFPRFEFHSAVELLMGGNGADGFISSLVHPSAAQIQTFLGYEQGRPSAPFSFTNEWGLNLAVTLPFFLVGWFLHASVRRRLVGTAVLATAVIPVVASLNRGLWLALIVCAVVLALRAALLGRPLALGGLLLGAAVAAAVILASPLGDLVGQRLDNGNSNNGRMNLGSQTLESTLTGSPLVGFGTTRDPSGNWNSIAAGSTSECPRCTPPPLGTQGHLWFLMFTTGFVGLALYLTFFGMALARSAFDPSPYSTAAASAVLMHLVTMPFYNAVDPALFVVMVAVGLMYRERLARSATRGPVRARWLFEPLSLGAYLPRARRHLVLLAVLVAAGAAVGATAQVADGLPQQAQQKVFVRDNRASETVGQVESASTTFSLDTEAHIVRSDSVADGIRLSTGSQLSDQEILDRLSVTAIPNTRILVVHVEMRGARMASAAVAGAADAYLAERTRLTTIYREGQIGHLGKRSDSLSAALRAARDRLPDTRREESRPLREMVSRLSAELRAVETERNRLLNSSPDVGQVVGNPTVKPNYDPWLVTTTSGAAVGLALWAFLVWLFDGGLVSAGRLLGGTRRRAPAPDVLCRISFKGRPTPEALRDAQRSVSAFAPVASVLSTGHSPDAQRAAQILERTLPAPDIPGATPRVVVVADAHERFSAVRRLQRQLRSNGLVVVGIVVLDGR